MNMHALRSIVSIVQAACLGFAAVMGTAATAAATDIKSMSSADLRALQERLRDAQCYTGAIDGSAGAATVAALERCPVMDPILTIETGMHTAAIKRIGVDRDCRLLATGADDKTVRLWSLPEGKPLRTLRLPIGPGNEGKVNAVAVSPDGGLIAAGGWDAARSIGQQDGLYLFDAVSGALKAHVGGFGNVVNHLAFSPDGRHLAVTLGGAQGLRVIDVQGLKEIAADRDYRDRGNGAAFAPDGRLFTVAYDGFLRAYDRSFHLVKKVATGGGKEPFSVAVDPGGRASRSVSATAPKSRFTRRPISASTLRPTPTGSTTEASTK
jgi:DNA-binding beta-propeller fold protein YncE